jgi:hypothetical protein
MTIVSFRLYSGDSLRNAGSHHHWFSTGSTISGCWRFDRQGSMLTNFQEVSMDNDSDSIGGYAVPVDPMDMLQCDSCQ